MITLPTRISCGIDFMVEFGKRTRGGFPSQVELP